MSYEQINGYHDAALKGIEAGEAPRSLALSFVLEDGQQKTLTLHGCEIFRINDFVNQNVVSRLLLFRGSEIDTAMVAEKLQWASSQSDTHSFLKPERLDELLAKIKAGALSLLVLEPSWGAEVAALFTHMSS
ncbi:hypothetical protein [Dyella sp.]|jgi:hypothetical protein|uniref:hypothetical protein n=1 Tax=Dyella sp. TaxID=1869338 RepID=UPI002FD9101F